MTATLLSSTAFGDYIVRRGESYASLAAEVTRRGARNKTNPIRCSKATIGHLVTGTIKGTSPARAKLIEEALSAPLGSLFLYRMTRVAQGSSRRQDDRIPA